MANFGNRLKALREARGWSQERVGFDLEVTKATVSKWETGRAEPGLDNLVKIRRLFAPDGVTLDYLLDADALHADTNRVMESAVSYGAPGRCVESSDEFAVLARFRQLTSRQQKALLDLLTITP